MPPRFSYWTIILDGQPTAFRAADAGELQPTLKQLQSRNPDAVMKWFARGKVWDSPEEARRARSAEEAAARDAVARSRGRDWRPGGEHKDPRERFKKETFQARRRRERKAADLAGRAAKPAAERRSDAMGRDEKPRSRDAAARAFPPFAKAPADGPPRPKRFGAAGRPASAGSRDRQNRGPGGNPHWQRDRKPTGDRKPGGTRPWHGDGARKPGGDRPWHGDGARKPGGDRPWHGGGTRKPGGDRPWHGGGTRKPGGDRPWHGGGTRKPGGDRPWHGDRDTARGGFGGRPRREESPRESWNPPPAKPTSEPPPAAPKVQAPAPTEPERQAPPPAPGAPVPAHKTKMPRLRPPKK